MKKIVFSMMALLLAAVVPAGAKKKAKQVQSQLTPMEVVEKVNNYWQANHAPEVNAFWDNAAYFTGNMEA